MVHPRGHGDGPRESPPRFRPLRRLPRLRRHGGSERNQIFYTHDSVANDGYTNWRTGEPNDCCDSSWGTAYNGNTLETNEHYPNSGGEHYTQFSNVISGTGYWNDLFVTGVTFLNPIQILQLD